MQQPKPLPEPEQERAHATQHPLVEGFLTFMTWKFGDGFWDVTLNISDEAPKDGKSDSLSLPGLDAGLYLEVDMQVSATVPTDMFLPGYPYLWIEELRAVLRIIEGGAAYADLLSSMKVRHNIPLYVVHGDDDDDDDDDDEPKFEEPESPGGEEDDGPVERPGPTGGEEDEVSPCSMEIIIGFDTVVAAGKTPKVARKQPPAPDKKEDASPEIS